MSELPEVKRFEFSDDEDLLFESDDGYWCAYAHYESLRYRQDAQEKESSKLLNLAGRSLMKAIEEIAELGQRLEESEKELERERMRLLACGVVALANTRESAAKQRKMMPEYWSASCGDVCNAIDREMDLRERLEESEKDAKKWRAVSEEMRRAIGDHYAPDYCYATGPMTGDAIRDLVECPACSAISMYEAAIAAEGAGGKL